MNRRTLLATGAATLGLGIGGCYAISGGDSDKGSAESNGDSRQDQNISEPETDPQTQTESNETSDGENETGPESNSPDENETGNETKDQEQEHEQEQPAEDRPDPLDTIKIVSHDITIEEYPQQDYTEVYVTGKAETGDYPLANVQIDAAGLDETGQVISHEYQQFATADANTTLDFEVPLYADPDLLESYQVSVTNAEYQT